MLSGGAGPARRVAVAVGLAASLCACVNSYPHELVPPAPAATAAPELYEPAPAGGYPLAPGDRVVINSYFNPALKQPVTIQPDGQISLLLLGNVKAAGKSPEELAKELATAYEKYVERPDITVTVDESAAATVYVGGEVAKPAMLPITGELSLLQSIIKAGGFLPTGNREQVLLLRKTENGRFQTVQANVEAVLLNAAPEIYLRRHDIVFVPKTPIAKLDLWVEQHINQIVPRSLNAVFGFSYPLTGSNGNATIITPAR